MNIFKIIFFPILISVLYIYKFTIGFCEEEESILRKEVSFIDFNF
jgi:hypothetical protein